ncbi:MAG: LacI family DNA-binding transcriptional regulator [Angelakisella sp.]
MGTRNKPTLSQVAELAGVSISAASMILNNRPDVTFAKETAQRVAAAAEQLGYESKSTRPSSRPLGAQTVLVFAPNATSPYYATLLQSIDQAAHARGYDTLIYNTYRDADYERRMLETIARCGVAGVIFTMRPTGIALVEQISRTIPVVVIADRDQAVNVDTVETSNFTAGALLAEHLIQLGHRNIGFLSTTLNNSNTARTKRLDGIRDAFSRLCPQGSVRVFSRNISPQQELESVLLEHSVGYALCREALAYPALTAMVGVNDMVAYGILDALLDADKRIPDDYSVAGFDNNFPSALLPVSLTSVEHCIEDKGHNAFDILYRKLCRSGSEDINCITRVEYRQHLVKRNSTAAPQIFSTK